MQASCQSASRLRDRQVIKINWRNSAVSPRGPHDYLTIKYSSAGTPLWTNRYNGPGNDEDFARAMAVDTMLNRYV